MSLQGGIPTRLDTQWSRTILGANGLPVYSGETLSSMRDRSRNLEDNNVLASAVLDRDEENVIGSGIKLRAATDDTLFNSKANDLWRRWVDGKFSDVRRMFSFDEIQQLVYRGKQRDGDIAVLFIDRGSGPELQVIEGEFISGGPRGYNSNIIDGVELNEANAPRAFWIRTQSRGMHEYKRVLARDVVFLFRSTRYNVVRGMPVFHGSYTLFDQIVGLLDAVVVAMRVGASQAMIVKKQRPNQTGLRNLTVNAAGEQVQAKVIEPGMINFIYTDEDISGFTPTQPGQSFPEAIRTFARFVGLKFGLTLERVMLDFSQANYSVSRSTAIQEMKTAEKEQFNFNSSFLARVWPWFIAKHIKAGTIDGQIPDDPWRYEWIPPARLSVDELQDMRAKTMAIELGVESRRNVAQERGYDFEQLVKDNEADNKLLMDAGLPTNVITGRPATAAQPQEQAT